MIPRRFYNLAIFSFFALFSVFVFLNRNEVALSVPASVSIPEGWKSGLGFSGDEQADPELKEDTDNKETTGSFIQDDSEGGVEEPSAVPPTSKTSEDEETFLAPYDFPPDFDLPEHIDVAIVDTSGQNEEVAAALIYAFGVQSRTRLSLYLRKPRFEIGSIINTFNLTSPIVANKSHTEFRDDLAHTYHPNIVVSVACDQDMKTLDIAFARLQALQKTFLFCFVHRPEEWNQTVLTTRFRPWMDTRMVDFVTLSEHTAHWLRTETINNWDFNATVVVRHMPPLFPIKLSADVTDHKAIAAESKAKADQYPITIYGDHDRTRHNYTEIYDNLPAVQKAAKNVTATTGKGKELREVSVRILGEKTPPEPPDVLKPQIYVENDPTTFQAFYQTLSKSYMVLPAFSSDDYLSKIASWCVPLSLIAGVPIVADEELLTAYNYLPRDAVWFRYAGETDMNVAERVVGWNATEHIAKKEIVRNTTAELIQRNIDDTDYWITLAMLRVQRAAMRIEQESE